jgi:signal transduction histidine kinase
MTLRTRLLSLTLSIVVLVALLLTAVSLNSLAVSSLGMALGSSEMAGRQVKSFLMRRLAETPANALDARQVWQKRVQDDSEIAALLEQVMVQSRSIVEIQIAGENSLILTSSNPQLRGTPMIRKQDLRALIESGPVPRMASILVGHEDYETRIPLGIEGESKPLFTTQILFSPALLRDKFVPELRTIAVFSTLALALAFVFAWSLARLALRPLARVEHLIDDIVEGKESAEAAGKNQDARELAVIETKLSLLGERYRDAREDATQLRTNLEGVLEKLDAKTRKQLETQLALAQRLTAINSLTGRVAHEIKNPLNSIALRLEMLRARLAEESPDSEPEFAILGEEIMRLDRVVRTFLDFNRPVELAPEDVNVGEMASELLRLLEPEARTQGIVLTLEKPSAPVVVRGDPGLLRQALLNIAVNAMEAMPDGGALRLNVERAAEWCIILLSDTGAGIPQEQQERIFQLYFTTKLKGSGIGLAMTFRAVQLHGGAIEVNSGGPAQGATFKITLPLGGSERIS